MKIVMIVEKKLKNFKKYKNAVITILFLCCYSSICLSQTTISGSVKDINKKSISFVNVFVKKDSLPTIINYAYADANGKYSIQIPNKGNYNLSFSSLGYKTKTILINVSDSKVSSTNDIILVEKPFSLDEVIVTSKNPIRIKNDTIVFNAKYFTTGNEQVVEDLLKKIPGISVDDNGTIKVGNQEIEKLMIDGDDFFEKGYKLLSKNMPSHPIEQIELLKNYSNNKLLKNIEATNKVALNLKLKEDFKRIWFGNIVLNYGIISENNYEAKFNLANFGKKNKYFFIGNLNNIGYEATGDIEQLIRPFRDRDEPASVGDNEKVNDLLNLNPQSLDFKKNRFNFNNAELISLNSIFKPTKKLKIKMLGFLNWDETDFFRNNINNVNINNTNFTNIEDYQLRNQNRIAFGKLDLTYNISKTKMLEATTKYNRGRFNDASNLVFNGNSTIENLKKRNTLFDQKISYTNKFKDTKAFLLTGRFMNEKTPQNYRINNFFFQELFPSFNTTNNIREQSANEMQFVGINAHLLNRKDNGHLFELQFGNVFRKDKFSSTFSLLEDDLILENPNGYQNQITYQVNDLYLKSKYRLKINDFVIVGKLNVHQLLNRLENNGNTERQSPFFINPSVGFDWEINDGNKIIGSYSYNNTNAKVLDVFSNFALTGFRSFSKGTGNFSQLNASNFFLNYQLGNWSDRIFVNTFIAYDKNHDFFSTNTIINQNYTQSEKILIKDREFISVSSKIDYYFKFISSNLKLDVGYSKSEFKNIVNNSELRSVTSNNYNYGLELRSGFKGIFNYHLGTKWNTNQIQANINNSFTNNISFLDFSFVFNDKLNMQFLSERYHFGNLQTDNTYYFLDFEVRYKLTKNRLTLGLTGKNIFNTRKFRNFTVSDIGSSTTEYRLLPRFVLLKLEYRL